MFVDDRRNKQNRTEIKESIDYFFVQHGAFSFQNEHLFVL